MVNPMHTRLSCISIAVSTRIYKQAADRLYSTIYALAVLVRYTQGSTQNKAMELVREVFRTVDQRRIRQKVQLATGKQ